MSDTDTNPEPGDTIGASGAPAGATTDTAGTGDETALDALDVGAHGAYDPHDTDHAFSDRNYIIVALVLAAITGLEVAISYVDIGAAFLPLLLLLMAIKFLTVVSLFMHLKFDNKLFGRLFYMGLILALSVYIVMLLTFRFFDS